MTNHIDKNEIVSIIYQTRNDSPKHVLLHKRKFLFFIVALPLITLIGITLGFIGLIHSSPFHLIQNYQKNKEAREAIHQTDFLKHNLSKALEENLKLKQELETNNVNANSASANQISPELSKTTTTNSIPQIQPTTISNTSLNHPGLSTLSLFKTIPGQKDSTRPVSLTLNDFKITYGRDNMNFQFNIINQLGGDVKLSGHIIVLMKNDTMIQIYPMNSLSSSKDYQINYVSGEPFATQRFRPVLASFSKPKKNQTALFTIFIFGKNGDLIHFQSVNMPVTI